jgi:phage regulator Rha-like protein
MHSQQILSNIPQAAPRFHNQQNVARTMSTREIAELTGKTHDNVLRDARRLVAEGVLKSEETPYTHTQNGQSYPEYLLSQRDTLVLVSGYSAQLRARIIDRWQDLESRAAEPADLSKLEILQMALESEKARVLLTVQVEAQAKKIDHLENLFKEGMSHVQFCKGLNGVNVMQVGHFLERRNWLYNESKSGTRYRVAAYARDKYMTEHQQEITPHGKEGFISYTPILLRKGAVRLYELYLAGEMPMKKNWDGLYTHDKAVRGAA